jgi:hypothetical protein
MMMAGCMLFSEKTDLLDYLERYKTHRGRAWLRSRCSMSENELRVLYGVRSIIFLLFGSMTKVLTFYMYGSFISYCTSQSAGDLPLKNSRGSRSSRTTSKWFLHRYFHSKTAHFFPFPVSQWRGRIYISRASFPLPTQGSLSSRKAQIQDGSFQLDHHPGSREIHG